MSAERVYVRTMPPALMTADQLLLTSIPDKRVELVRGVLVVRELKDATTTWFDMWRFKDGKADEHWDPATRTGP